MSDKLDAMQLSGEPTYKRVRLFDLAGDYVITLTLPAFTVWPTLILWKERRFARLSNDASNPPLYREASELRVDDDGEHLQSEI